MGLDLCCAFIHIHRLFEVCVANKFVLLSRVSVGEYGNTRKNRSGPSVYEILEIHSLFYTCWVLDCEHWNGDVKENS